MFILGAALTLATAYALGVTFFRKIPLPAVITFGLGACIESLLVYLFFLTGAGSFLPVIFAALPLLFVIRRPVGHSISPVIWLPFSIYGIYYLVHAMAPEIQPDAISYHLGLVAEYLRLGHFPQRVGFYEVLPQGLEMLFAAAFNIGGASAAKLVHFSFLLATLPLIILTARRLKLSDTQGCFAAALYFAAPAVGISGTSAYNDAALVFFTLATFHLLLLWRDTDVLAYAAAAGTTAGFCYAIKFTGLIVPPLAVLFIVWHRRDRHAVFHLSLGAALMIAPWMLRAFYLTHNPFAPLFNSLFPNLYFNPFFERQLAHNLTTYQGFHWYSALWAWGITGATQSALGPIILASPLAFLAWRKPAGRLLLISALFLLVPVIFNVGTRFLMPALPLLALALTIAIPAPALIALTVLQAVLCFPPINIHVQQPYSWSLRGFPWRAALRLQPESEYLTAATGSYAFPRFIEAHTTSADRIFALNGIAKLFTTREILEFWHSDQAFNLTAAIQTALAKPLIVRTVATWPPIVLTAIRFKSIADYPIEWTIFESRLYSPGGFLYASPQWNLTASTNRSGAPGAFDGNLATSWTSRTPQRRGMFLEADFNHLQLVESARFLIAASGPQPGFVIEGRTLAGKWQLLTDRFDGAVLPPQDLRLQATRALRIAGFTAISVVASDQGLGRVGLDMVEHPWQWGLRDLGDVDDVHLMRIEPLEHP